MSIQPTLQQAVEHHRAGRFAEAQAIALRVLEREPHNVDALELLSALAASSGRIDLAIDFLSRAAAIAPQSAQVHANLSNVCRLGKQYERAIAYAREAVRLDSDSPRNIHVLATALVESGRYEEALESALRLVEMIPDQAVPRRNLAVIYKKIGRLTEALETLLRAVELNPRDAEAQCDIGIILSMLGRFDDAAQRQRTALQLNPTIARSWLSLSYALLQLQDPDGAADAARRCIDVMPGDPDGYRNLAAALALQGENQAAHLLYDRALALLEGGPQKQPQLAMVWKLARVSAVGPIYSSTDDVQRQRIAAAERIEELKTSGARFDLTDEPAPTLFALAYQGRDDRSLMGAYAALMAPPPDPALNVESPQGRRIRVGFISRHFFSHTIAHLNRGLIAQLNRDEFDVHVFSICEQQDETSRFIRESAGAHHVLGPSHRAARQAVADAKLDVLFYTDIGMAPITYSLAFSRLARIQCMTWGHPVTSGIPAIDYFISSQVLDVESAQQHYTEKLVRLKLPTVYYYRPELSRSRKLRPDFGFDDDVHLYGCLQMLWKFHPDFDSILAQILRRDPKGRVLMLEGLSRYWGQKLRERFNRTIGDVADRIVFLPRQTRDDFLSLTAACDATLDPLHFGGGNTSYEAFALGVPVVTLPSQLLRGRITLAQYSMMGIDDFIADSAETYVEIAVSLGTDRERRNAAREKILASNSVLYENADAVRGFEEFLKSAVNRL